MPLQIIRQDITKMRCDAIVNAANETLLGGGGVDGAIHRAAGPGLRKECMKLGGCRVGRAKLTGAHALPCKYIIHTVGPRWLGGHFGEEKQLRSCYRSSLELAKEHGCESVAFPLISAGVFGYPKDQALRVAVSAIGEFLTDNEMTVYLVIFGKADYQAGSRLFADIRSYIDDNYAAAHTDADHERMRREQNSQISFAAGMLEDTAAFPPAPKLAKSARKPASGREETLAFILDQIDESFSEMLLRKIDERGMTDAQCYKKANIDRKLFSKIRSDPQYKPSKPTAIAFAIALELDLKETQDLLMKAGYALSHSSKFDLIVEYFIRKGNYDVFAINEALFAFDQSLLGA